MLSWRVAEDGVEGVLNTLSSCSIINSNSSNDCNSNNSSNNGRSRYQNGMCDSAMLFRRITHAVPRQHVWFWNCICGSESAEVLAFPSSFHQQLISTTQLFSMR